MEYDFRMLSEQFEEVFLSRNDLERRCPFRLFDLPPELWLRICEFAVTSTKPIQVGREPRTKDQVAIVRQPAITRACRLLRSEALPLYYSHNSFEIFHCYGIPCPRRWVLSIGKVSEHRS